MTSQKYYFLFFSQHLLSSTGYIIYCPRNSEYQEKKFNLIALQRSTLLLMRVNIFVTQKGDDTK